MRQLKKLATIRKEFKKMKKVSLILALAMALVLVFAATAFATPLTRTLPDYNGNGVIDTVDYPNLPGQNADLTKANSDNVHSDYNRNTDACAACHDTHTAKGKVLLQWAEIQLTCEACHDGTLGKVYNVKEGFLAGSTGVRTMGGLFNQDATKSPSKHKTGDLSNMTMISSAPGGNTSKATGEAGRFECSSCHEPHGSADNFRILSPDPAGMNLTLAEDSIAPSTGGTFAAYKVTNDILFAATTKGVTSKILTYDTTNNNYTSGDTWLISGYPFSYLYGVREVSVDVSGNVTKVRDLAKTEFSVAPATGIVTYTGVALGTDKLQAVYLKALKITGQVINKLQPTEVAQYGKGMNEFCGACHRDFNTTAITSPDLNLSGTLTTPAYRHKVGRDWSGADYHVDLTFGAESKTLAGKASYFTCLTCHVAHGVDEVWWAAFKVGNVGGAAVFDATGNKIKPYAWLGTVSPEYGDKASALKRLPNMSTCESCHAKGQANFNY